jgi:hypothetical protein
MDNMSKLKDWHRIGASAVIIAAINYSPAMAFASHLTTGQMLSYCSPVEAAPIAIDGTKKIDSTLSAGICVGYFGALTDVDVVFDIFREQLASARNLQYCLPEHTNTRQLIAVFCTYARAHPEEHHEQTFWTALKAFTQAFPCKRDAAAN